MSEMISVQNLTKSFGDFKALDNLNMSVERGSVYGLVGPNGAGKSTLIRHITGVFRADSGQVLVGGQQVYESPKVKQRIAFVPDDIYFNPTDNGLDQMKLYKGLYQNFDEELFKKLADCFSEVNLKKSVRNLSKGMQKQLSFMLSIACRPEVLILDEPVDGLDPVIRRQIWSILMQDVSGYGITVVVSSHNLRELEDVCDHVGIMNHGKLLLEKSLDDLQSDTLKLQVAFAEDKDLSLITKDLGFNVLKTSSVGKVHTLIISGKREEVIEKLKVQNPVVLDVLPLTLEEIFIYELGGEDYAVKDIIL